jgi:hypothetical protein
MIDLISIELSIILILNCKLFLLSSNASVVFAVSANITGLLEISNSVNLNFEDYPVLTSTYTYGTGKLTSGHATHFFFVIYIQSPI